MPDYMVCLYTCHMHHIVICTTLWYTLHCYIQHVVCTLLLHPKQCCHGHHIVTLNALSKASLSNIQKHCYIALTHSYMHLIVAPSTWCIQHIVTCTTLLHPIYESQCYIQHIVTCTILLHPMYCHKHHFVTLTHCYIHLIAVPITLLHPRHCHMHRFVA